MSKQVTIEIPEHIYQQVAESARASNRQVAEVITDALEESFFSRVPENTTKTALLKEEKAYHRMHKQLWKQYPETFVAIFEGQVIDYDQDEQALIARLDHTYPYPQHVVLVRKVMPELPKPLYFHSPRF